MMGFSGSLLVTTGFTGHEMEFTRQDGTSFTGEYVRAPLRKGSKIYAEGKLQTRSWDDKQTGAKRYATDVVVDHFQMLDGRPANADGEAGAGEPQAWGQRARGGKPATAAAAPPAADDPDLPF